MSKDFDIAIIGAGIAGATLAIALYDRGINVAIYESAHAFGVFEAFEKVCTRNVWPSKQKVWFDYVNGYNTEALSDYNELAKPEIAFTISNRLGQNGVHRARFLEEMVKLLPDGIAHFGKRLVSITVHENRKGKLVLHFQDGTSAETDAIIGCDGIKSAVRRHMVGEDSPSAW